MLARDDLAKLMAQLAPRIARDPRPAPALRVGAMGHRELPPGAEARALAAVEGMLAAIRTAADAALAEPTIGARFSGVLELSVVTPLAQGADQIIAIAGEKAGCRIGAILPFDAADYEATFDLAGADEALARFRTLLAAADGPNGYGVLVLDGDPRPAKRDEAFLVCASQITHWSDILIAILSDERLDSQTGQSVHEAIDTGMPVIRIDPRDQSIALYLDGVCVADNERGARLNSVVRAFLAPADAHRQPEHHGIDFAHYCAEHIACDSSRGSDFEYRGPYRTRTVAPFWARWCSGLNRGIERSLRRKSSALSPAEPVAAAAELPFGPRAAAPFVHLFLHFHRADVLANAYAEIYRSAHLLIAALGVAAVALGALGAVLGMWPPLFSGFEFLCFVFALCLVWISNRQVWLARWTHYRLLAEIFRYSKFLLVAGRPSPFGDGAPARQAWMRDHTEQVLRTYPLRVPGFGREPEAGAVAIARRYILGQCVDGQIRFHQATVPARLRMAGFLRKASYVLSLVTVLVLGVKFGAELLLQANPTVFEPHLMKPLLTLGEVLAIVLPALTAAVLALRAYGEHDVVAKRSAAMIESLERERRRVIGATNLDALGAATMRVVRILLGEVDGWVDLFVDKHLEA